MNKEIEKKILSNLIQSEGLEKKIYRCTAGHLTYGIGWKIFEGSDSDLQGLEGKKLNLSEQEIKQMALIKVRTIEKELSVYLWYNVLNTNRKLGILELCYWLGTDSFVKEWLLTIQALKHKDYIEVAKELMNSKIGRGEQTNGARNRIQRIADAIK